MYNQYYDQHDDLMVWYSTYDLFLFLMYIQKMYMSMTILVFVYVDVQATFHYFGVWLLLYWVNMLGINQHFWCPFDILRSSSSLTFDQKKYIRMS